MQLTTYINFNGNAGEALEFYKNIFKTEKPSIMYFDEMPESSSKLPEGYGKLVMHSKIDIAGTTLFISDSMPGEETTIGNSFSLILDFTDEAELKEIYSKLKEGGTEIMELQETFWSKAFGYIIDKFGVGWQFNLS